MSWSWFYNLVKFLMIVIVPLLTRWRVKGRENVPARGPLLVVANHISNADPPLIAISLGRKVTFMAKQDLFRSRLSNSFMHGFGAFPVSRGQMNIGALRRARRVLEKNRALVMFPEGRRSRKEQLVSAYSGAALIALRNNVPLLPVGIRGTEKMESISWLWHRPRITVNIGHPFRLPPVDGRLTREKLSESTDLVMEHIAELLPLRYRGKYDKKRK